MNNIKVCLQKGNLIKDYETMSCSQLSKKYGFHRETIRKALRGWGIKAKHKLSRSVNEDYFQTIDSHPKAYVLGFLCADGSINRKLNRLSFCINSKDRDVLDYINSELDSTYSIGCRFLKDSRNGNVYSRCTLQIYSRKIISDLALLGVHSTKSVFLHFPKIKDDYFYSFLCGLIDGDGSIHKSKTAVSLIGTQELLIYVKDRCKKDGINWAKTIISVGGKQHKMYLNKDTLKLRDRIYKNVDFFLKRKFDRFSNHITFQQNKKHKRMKHKVELYNENESLKFNSIKDAASQIKCNPSQISNVLNGNSKTVKGYRVKSFGKEAVEVRIGLDIDG